MTALAWAWFTWSVLMTGGCAFLWWRLEAERTRVLELQDQRVADAMTMATIGQPEPPEPQVDKVPSPEEAGQEAVRDLELDTIMKVLRRRARDEGKEVSDSRLRKDAQRIQKRLGMGPRAPNV